jgi:hypothetical protein
MITPIFNGQDKTNIFLEKCEVCGYQEKAKYHYLAIDKIPFSEDDLLISKDFPRKCPKGHIIKI